MTQVALEPGVPSFEDFRGRRVRLTDERLDHARRHPQLVGNEATIEATLRRPDQLRRSKADADVLLYLRRYQLPRHGEKYVCVVVKVLEEDAFVVTAYTMSSSKVARAGKLLWRLE